MKKNGFTLIELLLVIGILGILAAIAYPSLTGFIAKSKRSDATSALLGLHQAQTKLRSNCRYYASTMGSTNTAPCPGVASSAGVTVKFDGAYNDGTGKGASENNFYELEITSSSGNGYTATATAQGSQAADTNCAVFVLTVNAANPTGQKSSTDGVNPTTGCW